MGHQTIGTLTFISGGFSRLMASTVCYSLPLCRSPCHTTIVISIMTTPQIRCHRCNQSFTHHGLSQHISKTQDIRCCNIRYCGISQDPAPSTSVSHPVSSPPFYLLFEPPLDPPCASQVNLGDDPGVRSSDGVFSPQGLQHMLQTYIYFCSRNMSLMQFLQI